MHLSVAFIHRLPVLFVYVPI